MRMECELVPARSICVCCLFLSPCSFFSCFHLFLMTTRSSFFSSVYLLFYISCDFRLYVILHFPSLAAFLCFCFQVHVGLCRGHFSPSKVVPCRIRGASFFSAFGCVVIFSFTFLPHHFYAYTLILFHMFALDSRMKSCAKAAIDLRRHEVCDQDATVTL